MFCCFDCLDLMVESLIIGVMNVSLVIKYFCKVINMVVVIGGDCIDI